MIVRRGTQTAAVKEIGKEWRKAGVTKIEKEQKYIIVTHTEVVNVQAMRIKTGC